MTVLEAPDTSTGVDLPRPGGWSLHWRGRVFRESDMTGQHLATLALISGRDDFELLDIDPRHGHQRLMSVLTAFVVVEASQSVADEDELAAVVASKVAEVAKASVDEILGAIQFDS
jgi:hypothetical protein